MFLWVLKAGWQVPTSWAFRFTFSAWWSFVLWKHLSGGYSKSVFMNEWRSKSEHRPKITVQVQITVLYKLQTLPYARTHMCTSTNLFLCVVTKECTKTHTQVHITICFLPACMYVIVFSGLKITHPKCSFIFTLSPSLSLHEVRLKEENSLQSKLCYQWGRMPQQMLY